MGEPLSLVHIVVPLSFNNFVRKISNIATLTLSSSMASNPNASLFYVAVKRPTIASRGMQLCGPIAPLRIRFTQIGHQGSTGDNWVSQNTLQIQTAGGSLYKYLIKIGKPETFALEIYEPSYD